MQLKMTVELELINQISCFSDLCVACWWAICSPKINLLTKGPFPLAFFAPDRARKAKGAVEKPAWRHLCEETIKQLFTPKTIFRRPQSNQ
jgi:hypothetical protein